jgi:hypothetical protein
MLLRGYEFEEDELDEELDEDGDELFEIRGEDEEEGTAAAVMTPLLGALLPEDLGETGEEGEEVENILKKSAIGLL